MTREEELEAWVAESEEMSKAAGHNPIREMNMRRAMKARALIKYMLDSGNIQSGLKAAVKLGLAHRTLEAAAIKFADLFEPKEVEVARFRLDVATGKIKL